MDKFQLIIYAILIAISIGLLWTAMENNATNRELIDAINLCQDYYEGNWKEIERTCQMPQISEHLNTKNYIVIPVAAEPTA